MLKNVKPWSFCVQPNTVNTLVEETTGVPIHSSYIDKEMFPCPTTKLTPLAHYCGT